MKILVIGGTRLLGRAVVGALHGAGHELTVISRGTGVVPGGVTVHREDREAGLRSLSGKRFDVVMDFLAYDGSAVRGAVEMVPAAQYILISSTWMLRLMPDARADGAIAEPVPAMIDLLPDVTRRYLLGKLAAESECISYRNKGRSASILRLPIFLDANEHTGRLDFYCQRVMDGNPVICVDGGGNHVQLIWVRDAARVIALWCGSAAGRPIWEGLPSDTTSVRGVVGAVAAGLGLRPEIADVPHAELAARFPRYLDAEPLWRERPFPVSESNIFRATDTLTTPVSDWLSSLSPLYNAASPSALRLEEMEYLQRRAA